MFFETVYQQNENNNKTFIDFLGALDTKKYGICWD